MAVIIARLVVLVATIAVGPAAVCVGAGPKSQAQSRLSAADAGGGGQHPSRLPISETNVQSGGLGLVKHTYGMMRLAGDK